MRIFNKGFNFGQDGPGNRLVYHLQGCNMHCPWCSNPEGMAAGGKEYSPEELLQECIGAKMMFFSGGGVTFTGGEATLQHEELLPLLTALRRNGIHTALETNATSPHLMELSPEVDYLMMDFKHHDSERLRALTGVGNELICHHFEQLCRQREQLLVRIPLIHGVNTDDPEAFAAYFARFATERVQFEFLPYHEYGKEKWSSPYQIQDGFLHRGELRRFQDVFAQYGLHMIAT